MRRLRRLAHRASTRIYGPARRARGFAWIGGERLAIGAIPVGDELDRLPAAGFTHVVNCRAPLQTVISQDLARERDVFGADRVAHAPMWDNGRRQAPWRFAEAARFAAAALVADPDARVLIHCQQGRRRSAMVAYATLRLVGRAPADAAAAILDSRPIAQLVPEYRASVEDWLAAGQPTAAAADEVTSAAG